MVTIRGEEEVVNLEEEGYGDVEEFVSRPSFAQETTDMEELFLNKPGASTTSIIGTDDRWKITAIRKYPFRTIARIQVQYQDGTVECGTGAMISPKLVATAGHVLINSNGSRPKSIKMQFGQNGSEVFYETSSWRAYIYRGGFETDRPVEADYGFIALWDDTVSKATGYMGIQTAPSLDDRLFTAGYPGDKGPYYMYGATGLIQYMNGDLIYHTMDTYGGQSGSPVYITDKANSPYLVAMHTAGTYTSGGAPVNLARRLDPGLFQWLKDNGYLE